MAWVYMYLSILKATRIGASIMPNPISEEEAIWAGAVIFILTSHHSLKCKYLTKGLLIRARNLIHIF
jgi:hypothetical protein